MSHNFIYKTLSFLLLLCLHSFVAQAQPINDNCSDAIVLSMPNSGMTANNGPFSNVGATLADDDPVALIEGITPPCFAENQFGQPPLLNAPIWFTLQGDGDSYHIYTSKNCGAFDIDDDDYIDAGDTQMAIFTGECGTYTLVDCNEDDTSAPGYGSNNWVSGLTIATQESQTYYIMIDALNSPGGFSDGDFCVNVTTADSNNECDAILNTVWVDLTDVDNPTIAQEAQFYCNDANDKVTIPFGIFSEFSQYYVSTTNGSIMTPIINNGEVGSIELTQTDINASGGTITISLTPTTDDNCTAFLTADVSALNIAGFCGGAPVNGCTDSNFCNFDPAANVDDGSCSNADPGTGNTDICEGDTETWNEATCSYDVVIVQVLGCTDPNAPNYNPNANCDNGSCATPEILGCIDPEACNYNPNATIDDQSCSNEDPGTGNEDICQGDTEVWNEETCNYDIETVQVLGCTNPDADNYNSNANCDDGTCSIATVPGCIIPSACNYDPNANVDDGSCFYETEWFQDSDGDGLGNPNVSQMACEQPEGYVANSDDPLDECSGELDECDICNGPGPTTWYADVDNDGLGDPDNTQMACEQPAGYVANANDDNDECDGELDECGICNGIGIAPGTCDCDGTAQTIWYADADNDGEGNPNDSQMACEQPDGYVANADDADDTTATSLETLEAMHLNQLTLSPNPVQDFTQLQFASTTNQKMQIKIMDLTGKIILTKNIQVYTGENTFNINASVFASGTYLMSINSLEDTNNNQHTLKFVVQ